MLDFDFEKVCSQTLSDQNVYACLVCGKFFQGRGRHTHAYFRRADDAAGSSRRRRGRDADIPCRDDAAAATRKIPRRRRGGGADTPRRRPRMFRSRDARSQVHALDAVGPPHVY